MLQTNKPSGFELSVSRDHDMVYVSQISTSCVVHHWSGLLALALFRLLIMTGRVTGGRVVSGAQLPVSVQLEGACLQDTGIYRLWHDTGTAAEATPRNPP